MAQIVLPNSIDAGTEIVAAELQSNFVALRDTVNGDLEGGATGNLKANGVTARELADALLATMSIGKFEGVRGQTALAMTPGAGLVLNVAAGSALIQDDSGIVAAGSLIPVTYAGGSVTIGANATGNPRVDQVIATMTGYGTATVSVLAGTATAGATMTSRAGAAALPSDAVRLYDVFVPNAFAGPFTAEVLRTNSPAFTAGSFRDRRPQASGIYARDWNAATSTISSAAFQDAQDATTGSAFELMEVVVPAAYAGAAYGIVELGFATTIVKGAGSAGADQLSMAIMAEPMSAVGSVTANIPWSASGGASPDNWRIDDTLGGGAPTLARRFWTTPMTAHPGPTNNGWTAGNISGAGDPTPSLSRGTGAGGVGSLVPVLITPGTYRFFVRMARTGTGTWLNEATYFTARVVAPVI